MLRWSIWFIVFLIDVSEINTSNKLSWVLDWGIDIYTNRRAAAAATIRWTHGS